MSGLSLSFGICMIGNIFALSSRSGFQPLPLLYQRSQSVIFPVCFFTAVHCTGHRFVTGIIPPGNEELKGDEADQIRCFKDALGLEDPEAASVHIEV